MAVSVCGGSTPGGGLEPSSVTQRDGYMTKRTGARIEPHQGTMELACDFAQAYGFVNGAHGVKLETSTGTAFTAEVGTTGRKVIRFFQGGREYARAYPCCWGHYYNCNRTRIGMYCVALDRAARRWFERKVAELKDEMEKLPADRQAKLKRELDSGNG
jgi:hypothetical protein